MSSAKTRRRWPRTIGFRLTLWGAGVTCFVCLLFGVILYLGMYFSLRGEIDGFLEGEVHEFVAILRENPGDLEATQRAIRLELGSRSRRDLMFRLIGPGGKLLVSSDPLDRLPTTPPEGTNAAKSTFETISVKHARFPVRTCTLVVRSTDGQSCYAQAAYVLERMTTSLAGVRRACGVGLLIAVLVAVLGGRVLAARSLKPIAAMTRSARRIGASRLGDRLPRTGTGDQLDRLAETLNEMLDRIERQVRQIQQFTADASHELRSPLAALRGNAEVALTQPRSAEQLREVIEESVEHYDRLTRIAEDLLLLARLDAGEPVLHREAMRLDQAVADMVDLYSPFAAERDVALALATPEPLPMQADAGRLRQLVGNLIDNALKFTPTSGRVTVALARDNGCATLTVSDTGVGISPEDLPRVFDRFYRSDRSRSTRGPSGAGLGLAICRGIAEAHGGRIDVESSVGGGTTVRVLLPLGTGGETHEGLPSTADLIGCAPPPRGRTTRLKHRMVERRP